MNTTQVNENLYQNKEGALTVDAPSIHALHGAMAKGKKSEAGLAASALNARKHGLSSKTFVVLPTERMDLFLEHKLQLEITYRPQDAMEFELVGQMAEAVWLIDRSKDMERAALRLEIQRQRLAFDERGEGYEECMLSWLAMEELQVKNRAFTNLMRYRAQHERTFLRCQRALDTHRKNKSLIPAAGLEANPCQPTVKLPQEPFFVSETREYKTKPPTPPSDISHNAKPLDSCVRYDRESLL